MPKQPAGISKSIRMQAIVEMLDRAGILDKQAINQRLASHFSIDPKEIERAVYRDLTELVEIGKIKVCSQNSLGQMVNPELEDVKNFKNFWFTDKHSPFAVSGSGYLDNVGASLISHDSLQSYIKCRQCTKTDKYFPQILLHSSTSDVGLFLDKEITPLKIYLARKEESSKEFESKFFKKFTKRSIILQLSDNSFSRYKGDAEKELNHLVIESNSIKYMNLTKHPIKYKKIDKNQAFVASRVADSTHNLSDLIDAENGFTSTSEAEVVFNQSGFYKIKIGTYQFVIQIGEL